MSPCPLYDRRPCRPVIDNALNGLAKAKLLWLAISWLLLSRWYRVFFFQLYSIHFELVPGLWCTTFCVNELKVRVQNTADRYLPYKILICLRAIVNVLTLSN